MIRIDEIYDNIFSPIITNTPKQSMHFFDPFGRTDIDALKVKPLITDRDTAFLFWDQEPYLHDIHCDTINHFTSMYSLVDFESVNIPWLSRGIHPSAYDMKVGEFAEIPKLKTSDIIFVTSEKDSENVKYLEQQFGFKSSYYFFHGWAALDWFRGYNRTNLIPPYSHRNITNTFICLNRIVSGNRTHRVDLFRHIAKNNLIDGNVISFPLICPHNGERFEIDGISLPLVIGEEDPYNIPNESYKISLWEQSSESLLYVVTETVYKEKTLHLTEKSFKPIVMQMPFILVAPQHSLKYLRSYGFKTFGDIWDESYDEEDNDTRMNSIAKLLTELNSVSDNERKQLQRHLTPIVEHNFRWFYSNEFENLLWDELTNMTMSWN